MFQSLSEIIGDTDAAQTSAGSTQATAALMLADHVQLATVGVGEGIILREGNAPEIRSVCNAAASNNLYVYPPVGASFNGKATNGAIDLPAGRSAFFIFTSATKINVIA